MMNSGSSFARIIAFGLVGVIGAGLAAYQYFQIQGTSDNSHGRGSSRPRPSSQPRPLLGNEINAVCERCNGPLQLEEIRRLEACKHLFHDHCLPSVFPIRCPRCSVVSFK